MRVAEELLDGLRDAYVVGDRAYSAAALVERLQANSCEVVIPPNPTHRARYYDKHLYKERYLVENFFQRLKRNRRLAMRYEKLSNRFLAFVLLASIVIWLF